MTSYSWHHVHVAIRGWHEAAKWREAHLPVQCEWWDHPAHKGDRSEVLRCGPNGVLVQKMQYADEPSSAEIDSIGFAVRTDPCVGHPATWLQPCQYSD
ncbi:MAG: hypothetical protein QGH99_07410 [Pseudomonadales bacterium]|nr:hypothetical protein [Pseudomonadales bacterium]